MWYATNAYAGIRLLVTGVVTMLAALVFYFVSDIDVDTYAWACLGVFALVFGISMVQSWRFMNTLSK